MAEPIEPHRTLIRPLTVAAALLIGSALAQDPLAKLDRLVRPFKSPPRGVHHASMTYLVVDAKKKPIADVRAVLYSKPEGWGGAPWPVAEARSDKDGKLRFDDVNAPDELLLSFEPPAAWVPLTFTLGMVSGDLVDMGPVTLRENRPLGGTVALTDAAGKTIPCDDCTISLSGLVGDDKKKLTRRGAVVDGRFFIDDVPDGAATIELSLSIKKQRQIYRGEFTIGDASSRNLTLSASEASLASAADSRSTGEDMIEPRIRPKRGKLEISPKNGPLERRPRCRSSGRVVDSKGKPVAGARVYGFSDAFYDVGLRSSYTTTGPDGAFTLDTEDPIDNLIVASALGEANLTVRGFMTDKPASIEKVVLADTKTAQIAVPGVKPEEVSASWNAQGAWQPCPFDQLGRFVDEDADDAGTISTSSVPLVYRLAAPGRIPMVIVINAVGADVKADFGRQVPHELRVMSGTAPLAGAFVDLTATSYDEPDSKGHPIRRAIETYKTGADGTLKLLGDPSVTYEVDVYAPGHAHASRRWRPGEKLEIALAKRAADVNIAGVKSDEIARIKHAGTDEVVGVIVPDTPRPVAFKLAPGAYDAVVWAADGKMRGKSFTAALGGAATISLAEEGRPRIVVKLPASEDGAKWWANLSRDMPMTGTTGAAISTNAGAFGFFEPQAGTVDKAKDQLTIFASGVGPYHLSLGSSARRGVTFVREIELAAGEKVSLAIPALDATIEGAMSGFSGGAGFSQHGVAGPRLILIANPDTKVRGWDVFVNLPKRKQNKPNFEIASLPAGEYFAFDQLASDPAWGGVAVTAKAGETTAMPDVAERRPKTLDVEVVDAAGRPLRAAVLKIRDRMSESWEQFKRLPTTATLAEYAIPLPPASRLSGTPVTFSEVREGVVEFEVSLDDGTTYRLWRSVTHGTPVKLSLPAAKK